MKLASIAAALGLLAAGAHAAAPTAVMGAGSATTFAEFVASGPAVGDNGVNVKDSLYWIDEAVSGGFKSFYVFYDPAGTGKASATITFDAPIASVIVDQAGLQASAAYGKAGVTYAYDGDGFTGLEASDLYEVSGNTLKISWFAANPGDHMRILLAVPEPSTYALMGAGLLAIGVFASRRRRQD